MEKSSDENPGISGQIRVEDDESELTSKQIQALGALLDSPSIVAAARRVGIDESTIRRWIRPNRCFRKSCASCAPKL